MPLLILLAIFGIYVYLELSLLITIGSAIGVFPLILLLIVSSMIGLALIRLRGWYTLSRVSQQLRQGEMPTHSLVQTALWLLAGILFIIPGLLSDLVAILLLLPFSATLFEKLIAKKIRSFTFVSGFGQSQPQRHHAEETIFEAEYDKKADDDKRLP
ncbi:FxsA family protein [Testudinibacter sp. P80/BLE/0925]|uniref:FxsA family protein n=1 Tax=Testudinibacter sp. TW-1 TaxID=3417757 RepID=UPI003D36A925